MPSGLSVDESPRRPVQLALVGFCLAFFGLLAAESVTGFALGAENDALRDLHAESSPVLESLMRFVSTVGGGGGVSVVAIAVSVGLLIRRRRFSAMLFALMMIGASLNRLLKVLFDRPRPDLWASATQFSGLSFPSGHATSSATLVAALMALTWRTRWRVPVLIGGVFVMAIIGFSRLVLGAHYPSDVLGAWAFAFAWVGIIHLIARRWLPAAVS